MQHVCGDQCGAEAQQQARAPRVAARPRLQRRVQLCAGTLHQPCCCLWVVYIDQACTARGQDLDRWRLTGVGPGRAGSSNATAHAKRLHYAATDAALHMHGNAHASLRTRKQGVERRLVRQLHRTVEQHAMRVQRVRSRLAPQLPHQPVQLVIVKCKGTILHDHANGRSSGKSGCLAAADTAQLPAAAGAGLQDAVYWLHDAPVGLLTLIGSPALNREASSCLRGSRGASSSRRRL